MLSAAKLWAASGRPVFPIWPIDPQTLHCTCAEGADCNNKHPILKNAMTSATTDPVAVEKLWRRATFRMRKVFEEQGRPWTGLEPAIGGGTAGLIVLDIDSAQGYDEWTALQEKNGAAPATMTTASGRAVDDSGTRGAHIAFRIPPNLPPEQRDRLTIWGGGHLDGRANGKGWVVLPPSLHRSGYRYVVTDNSPVAEAPQWIVDYALNCIGGAKGKRAAAKQRSAGASVIAHQHFALPESHPLYALGYGVCWRPTNENDRSELMTALAAADSESMSAAPGSRPSVDRQKWLGVIWSLRAHESYHQDGFAHNLALRWSQQFASHTDDSFYRTVWNRPAEPGQAGIGKQRIFDLAEQNAPGWRERWARQPAPYCQGATVGGNGATSGASGATVGGNGATSGASGATVGGNGATSGASGATVGGGGATPPTGGFPPGGEPSAGKPVICRNDPSATADMFLSREAPTLLRTNDEFLEWRDGAYADVEDAGIQARVRKFLRNCLTRSKNGETGETMLVPFHPKIVDVNEVFSALKNSQHCARLDRPAWLNGHNGPDPRNIIAFPNTLLDAATGKTYQPTPEFFTRSALPFDHDPSNKKVDNWLKFLNSIFGEEGREEKIRLLQQSFGYLVSGDTSLQKIFLLIGPARSGKGTIAKVIESLVGRENTYSTTFTRMGSTFGQAGFIGKSVVLFPDAHMGQWGDRDSTAEMLKSISGEDVQSVPRKYASDWRGQLGARFVVLANTLPEFPDASGAFASRFVTLQMDNSHIGQENPKLFADELVPELPGILNWALDGLADLRAEGTFTITENARQLRQTMDTMNNPIRAFAEERLVFKKASADGSRVVTAKSDIYNAYRVWCAENGVAQMSSIAFGRKLLAVSGNTIMQGGKTKVKNAAGKRVDAYVCVELNSD